jgi:hypothetical protein
MSARSGAARLTLRSRRLRLSPRQSYPGTLGRRRAQDQTGRTSTIQQSGYQAENLEE